MADTQTIQMVDNPVNVNIDEKNISVGITEEQLTVNQTEEQLAINITEEALQSNITEETIQVSIEEEAINVDMQNAVYEVEGTSEHIRRIRLNGTAGENISALRVLRNGNDNQLYIASCSNLDHQFRIVGISYTAASTGNTIYFITDGEMEDVVWNWDTSKGIYLGENGVLTQNPPASGFYFQVATPITNTKISVSLKQSIKIAS